MTFATVRLGKASVSDIRGIDAKPAGIVNPNYMINVQCTQVPPEFALDTYVFIWLGSDNSKGLSTAWKQGFKAIGKVTQITRGTKYNDSSTFIISIGYILSESVSRVDFLRDASAAYYWCSSLPVIGLDDHSNQTVRMITPDGELSQIGAFLKAFTFVRSEFEKDITAAYPDLAPLFAYDVKDPRSIGRNSAVAKPIRYLTGLKSRFARNRITFGAPGTGKSFTLNREKNELINSGGICERVTFHPDYSFANFVGTYKPVPIIDDNGKSVISYKFVPGPFMRVYVAALKNSREDAVYPHILLIEEINRADVAAVFGEVFQLLDRNDDGISEYPICASEDIKSFLAESLSGIPSDYAEIMLPDNMFIWATMNSADQGVFPMDTAFKRRWDFTYIGINAAESKIAGKTVVLGTGENERAVEWNKLRRAINDRLSSFKINEDKLLGPFFLSRKIVPENAEIDQRTFVDAFKNKVLMYLFDDAAKQKRASLFADGVDTARYSAICESFEKNGVFVFCSEISSKFTTKPVPAKKEGASQ